MIFCKHSYPEYWSATFPKDGEVTWVKECKRCGKRLKFTMPLYNVKPAWEQYNKLKKEYKI